MGPEWFQVMVSVVLGVLHLQRHDFLLLAVGQVVGRSSPLGRQPVAPHLVPLVSLVVKCGKRKDIKEKEGCTHGDCHAQFC